MKITKTFGMTISGAYQSYRFENALETDIPGSDISAASASITQTLIDCIEVDIKNYATNDKDFAIVLSARNNELEKLRKKESYSKPQ